MPATGSKRGKLAQIFDYSLAAIVSVALTIYLVYALLRPEQILRDTL
jgi:K+-transporting ATPase KdpF subunit